MSISRARQSSRPSTAAAKVCIRPDFEAAMATPTSKFTGQIAPLCDHGSPPLRTCSSVSGFRNDSKTETGRSRWRSLQAQILARRRGPGPSKARQPSRQDSFPKSSPFFYSAFQRRPRVRQAWIRDNQLGAQPAHDSKCRSAAKRQVTIQQA